ncbi:MAG: LysM peptidoglycan-binding domain-containing protein [Clostridiales bacterium]|jgi:LysM repeat protein|nr:LysM peptidoglycan-binding domain-containing protein [Clostridiales bacterium]
MANNTYEGDVGIKYNFVKDNEETEEKKTDDIFAGGFSDDEDDTVDAGIAEDFDDTKPFDSAETRLFDTDEQNPEEKGFSVLSDRERKYRWEKPLYKGEVYSNPEYIPKPRKTKDKRGTDTDNDEYYDLEIGGASVGLKILMSLMLITFIVIISILIYKFTVLNDEYQAVLLKLEAAPTVQELEAVKADIQVKEQTIKRLTAELGQYKVANAISGELVEASDGWWYVVAQNDTLGQISQKFEVNVSEIMKLNDMDNADHIKAGQRLKIKEPEQE